MENIKEKIFVRKKIYKKIKKACSKRTKNNPSNTSPRVALMLANPEISKRLTNSVRLTKKGIKNSFEIKENLE